MSNVSGRIGCFFLFVGAVLMVIFLASDLATSPALGLLFWGVLSLLAGLAFWRKGYSPPPSSNRFRILRRKKDNPPPQGK